MLSHIHSVDCPCNLKEGQHHLHSLLLFPPAIGLIQTHSSHLSLRKTEEGQGRQIHLENTTE